MRERFEEEFKDKGGNSRSLALSLSGRGRRRRMYIKSVTVHGFKSYKEPVTIHLSPGCNVVVGEMAALDPSLARSLPACPLSSAFLPLRLVVHFFPSLLSSLCL